MNMMNFAFTSPAAMIGAVVAAVPIGPK